MDGSPFSTTLSNLGTHFVSGTLLTKVDSPYQWFRNYVCIRRRKQGIPVLEIDGTNDGIVVMVRTV